MPTQTTPKKSTSSTTKERTKKGEAHGAKKQKKKPPSTRGGLSELFASPDDETKEEVDRRRKNAVASRAEAKLSPSLVSMKPAEVVSAIQSLLDDTKMKVVHTEKFLLGQLLDFFGSIRGARGTTLLGLYTGKIPKSVPDRKRDKKVAKLVLHVEQATAIYVEWAELNRVPHEAVKEYENTVIWFTKGKGGYEFFKKYVDEISCSSKMLDYWNEVAKIKVLHEKLEAMAKKKKRDEAVEAYYVKFNQMYIKYLQGGGEHGSDDKLNLRPSQYQAFDNLHAALRSHLRG